jgi:hypothetical protein
MVDYLRRGTLACAGFDLIGRHVTGHGLGVPRTSLISFTGYFFSLNLGALVGGLAFRYRLYMPYGLSGFTISQIIGLSVVTNWSGYVVIAGAVMAYQPPELPPGWEVGSAVRRYCARPGSPCFAWLPPISRCASSRGAAA